MTSSPRDVWYMRRHTQHRDTNTESTRRSSCHRSQQRESHLTDKLVDFVDVSGELSGRDDQDGWRHRQCFTHFTCLVLKISPEVEHKYSKLWMNLPTISPFPHCLTFWPHHSLHAVMRLYMFRPFLDIWWLQESIIMQLWHVFCDTSLEFLLKIQTRVKTFPLQSSINPPCGTGEKSANTSTVFNTF